MRVEEAKSDFMAEWIKDASISWLKQLPAVQDCAQKNHGSIFNQNSNLDVWVNCTKHYITFGRQCNFED
jgi:hypothetical protein